MKLRIQLLACVAASAVLSLGALFAVLGAARQEVRTADAQASAQAATHQVLGLLVLTQEYARHAEERAAQQWHDRHRAVLSLLPTGAADNEAVGELRAVARDLPALFVRLQDIGDRSDAFSVRRREMLLDQLLASSQAMSDHAAQWFEHAAVARTLAERRFLQIAVAAPLLLLALLTTLALLVHRRVLRPLNLLHDATAAVASGNLQVRVGLSRNDEIGEVARRFDDMTLQLALRGEQLQRSEKQLRAVADNIPALVAYIDRDVTLRYANAYYGTVYGVDPEQLVGRGPAVNLSPQAAQEIAPHIAAVLAGERQSFERHATERGIDLYLQTEYVPDIQSDGSVSGFYVMAADITARKRAELAQARSEEQIRSILTHAPDAFVSVDGRGRLTEWNRQAQTIFGWQRDEVLGRPLAEVLIPQALRQAHDAGFARFLTTGQGAVVNQRVELQALHKDGGQIPIELSVAAVRDGSGWTANAFLRDISQRKQAEQALQAGERRLRSITDNLPAMVGYFDRDERCLYANEAGMRLQRIKPGELVGHTLRSAIGDEAYALHAEHVQAVLGGERRYFEGRLRRDQREVHFQAYLVPSLAADGQVEGFYVMTFDVSGVRQAQLAQQRSEERLRQIADNLPVLISYLDTDERVEFANATWDDWMGLDCQAMVGQRLGDLLPAALYEPRRDYLQRALAGERVEFENEGFEGSMRRVARTSFIPHLDASGQVCGIYALSTDITQIKQAQAQLQALARHDPLTGLANRLLFNEKLPEALLRSERSGDGVALLFLDVDHFKRINDTLGHAGGDAVLQEFGKRLCASVRASDTVARLGGDEFVVILEGLHHADEVAIVGRKIVAAFAAPMQLPGQLRPLHVTASIGGGFHAAAAGRIDEADLLARADAALYAAKEAGRNTFSMAGADHRDELADSLATVS